MSWLPVDFNLVRYSPIEGRHYFHDPALPASIQFLSSGRWEPWDVGWVKQYVAPKGDHRSTDSTPNHQLSRSQDPDIQRIAQEAEARLIQDPNSGYIPWSSSPLTPSNSQFSPLLDTPGSMSQHSPTSPVLYDRYGYQSTTPPSPQTLGLSLGQNPFGLYMSPHPQFSAQASQMSPPPATCSTWSSYTPASHAVPTSAAFPTRAAQASPPQPASSAAPVFPRTRETKILLSIDGDGIRGLSALLLIETLIQAVCVRTGQQLGAHQIFDLTGGSSLGGVIAIMLCRLRMQRHRAREAYKKISRQVYLNKKDFFLSLDRHSRTPRVDAMALEEEIKTFVQQEAGDQNELLLDGRESQGAVFVVSTHIEIGTNKPALIRSYQSRRITGPELDAEIPIWRALKATSVAPRYMTPQAGFYQRLVIGPGLVDHGTAKNNPVRDIVYECRKLFRHGNDTMIIVSIGTGVGHDRKTEIPEMAKSVEDRNAEGRNCREKFELDHRAMIERGWMKYFRFNVCDLDDVPLEEWCEEDVLKAKTSAYLARPHIQLRFSECVDAISSLLYAS